MHMYEWNIYTMNFSYLELIFAACLLSLSVLHKTSSGFRYYFKFSLINVIPTIMAVFCAPFLMFRLFDVSNFVVAGKVMRHVPKLIGVKYTLKGKEYLEKKRPCVIVANHQSYLDILGMFSIWHIMDKCTIVAKKQFLSYQGPFGIVAYLCGLVFIDRDQKSEAQIKLNEAVKDFKTKNIKLWIFPEGTRRNTGVIHQFKKGAFRAAISAQVPILPLVYSYYYFLDHEKKRFDNGEIIITTLPPISTEGLTNDDVDELMENVHKIMTNAYEEVNQEVKTSISSRNGE